MLGFFSFGASPPSTKTTFLHKLSLTTLAVREEIIELALEERKCPKCGKPYSEMGSSEESEEVGIEKEYYIKQIRRRKYKRTRRMCSSDNNRPSFGKINFQGKFSVELCVDILINKFQNHQAIERQTKEMAEYGLKISSGTICKGLLKNQEMSIKGLYEGMIKSLWSANHYHGDENWGNHSFIMDEFSSAIFSIIQTCLMHNIFIFPRKYLTYYFNECLKKKIYT